MMSRVDMLSVLLLPIFLYLSICVYKNTFVTPDGISVTFGETDIAVKGETFTFSAMWLQKYNKYCGYRFSGSRKNIFILMLLMCGDIESCPGPQQDCLGEFLNSRGLKMFHQNVRGLFSNFVNVQELLDRGNRMDILSVSETHIIINDGYDDNDTLYTVDGYRFIKRNRDGGRGGGVAVYLKDNIEWQRRSDLEREAIENIWIEIFIPKSKSILLGIFYRPPGTSKYLAADFIATFNEMLAYCSSENKEAILLGDFNVNYLNNGQDKEIKDAFRLYGFKQIIKKATRVSNDSSSLIDLIVTNNPLSISKCDVFPTCIGDHDMVGCVQKINNVKFIPKIVMRRNYSSYNPSVMNEEFTKINWDPLYLAKDVNVAVSYFNETVKSIFDKYAPNMVKKVRGKPCPWIHHDLRASMIDRNRMLKKARESKMMEDWNIYKRLRNACNNKLKSAKSSFQRRLLDQNSLNPRKFWQVIKKILPF